MAVRMDDGFEAEHGLEEFFFMPARHDAWIVRDKRCVLLDFTGMTKFAKTT